MKVRIANVNLLLMYITPQINVTMTYNIQPSNAVTMAMEMLHNNCNIFTLHLTFTFSYLSMNISQITCVHVATVLIVTYTEAWTIFS